MDIFTQVRKLAIQIIFFILLSCFLSPLRAENKQQQVVSSKVILHEIDSISKLIPSLNSIERRLEYEKYKHQADSLWTDVSTMSVEDTLNNYRVLMCTILLVDSSQPIKSFYSYLYHLKTLSNSFSEARTVLKLHANSCISHVYLLALDQFKAYPLLEDIVQCVLKRAQVDSLTHIPRDNPHLALLYSALLHQMLCYQLINDSISVRNRTFLDSPLGEYSKTLDENCSTSGKIKAIAYRMVDEDYQGVINMCDTLVRNQRLSGIDILFILKIQLDAINRLPSSPAMIQALLRSLSIQDSVLAQKEATNNIDYTTYNELNHQHQVLSDFRHKKEKIRTQHLVIACSIAILAVCVVLYLLYEYRRRSRLNLAVLKELQASAAVRKVALDKAEEACEQQLNLMRNFNHDLRVPMNALVGFSNILGSDHVISESEQIEAGEIVNRTSRQLLDMVNTILDIARISTGHMMVDNQETPVAQILDANQWRSFVSNIEPTHTLTISAYEEDNTATMDSKHVVRIIELLLKNAILTSESGEITLCAHTDKQQRQVLVDVKSVNSHQALEGIFNCLDRNKQIADYTDTNEYYLVLARMLCDLIDCDLMPHENLEVGVNMQLSIPLNTTSHES